MRRWIWTLVLGAAAVLAAAAAVLTFTGGGKQNVIVPANISYAPLLGVSVASKAILAQDTAEFGHLPIVREYYPGLPSANAWTTGLPAASKSAVIVSFKALPSAILSGADNAALSHFFDTAPRGHTIYYTYYHEPEDNIAAGQFSLAAYKQAWARVAALADAAHNPDLHSTLILMAYDLKPASHRNWKNYLPGGGIISTLGWDAYPQGTGGGQHVPQLTPPATFMGPAIAASRSVGLPYGFAEFGLSIPNGRPSWLTQVGNYLMTSGALFGTLFNSTIVTNGRTMDLAGDNPSVTVWRSFVARSAARNCIGSRKLAAALVAPKPPAARPRIGALSLSPATLTMSDENHITISFTLTKRANVTVCVLDSDATVVSQLAKPDQAAGHVTIPYSGFNNAGRRDQAGRYRILIVASNANGRGTATAMLTINAA